MIERDFAVLVTGLDVFRDQHDADAARRYKMIYNVGPGEMRVRFSRDGLSLDERDRSRRSGPRRRHA